MSKFLVNLELTGYDSLKEKITAEEDFISEQLECSGGGVSITKLNFSYPQVIFICRKCSHRIYVSKERLIKDWKLPDDCPECGEESYENWIFEREGNYEKEYD